MEKKAALELIQHLGMPGVNSSNYTVLDAICRATMRHPSEEALLIIAKIKYSLGNFFKNKSDEQIVWILGNSSETRGHFKSADAVKAFCSGKMETSSSVDIVGLEMLLSAINYSFPNPKAAIQPDDPNINIKTAIKELVAGAPSYIGVSYTQRSNDMSPGRTSRGGLSEEQLARHNQGNSLLIAPNRAISIASGITKYGGFFRHSKKKPDRQQFYDQGYAKLVAAAGVPLVGHVSGTTPGNLHVASNLLKQFKDTPDDIGLTATEATTYAGLIAGSFHRAGFHSPPEVLVGLRHYLGIPATETGVAVTSENIRTLFAESLELIADASRQDLRDAIKLIIDDLKANPNLLVRDEKLISEIAAIPEQEILDDATINVPDELWEELEQARFQEEDDDIKPSAASSDSVALKKSLNETKTEGNATDSDVSVNKNDPKS